MLPIRMALSHSPVSSLSEYGRLRLGMLLLGLILSVEVLAEYRSVGFYAVAHLSTRNLSLAKLMMVRRRHSSHVVQRSFFCLFVCLFVVLCLSERRDRRSSLCGHARRMFALLCNGNRMRGNRILKD